MQHLECKGHNRPIRMMKFNREGDFLFSCSDDATVCVWKILPSPTLLGKIKCKSAIKSMDVDYLTKYVITAEAARGVGIYNALGVYIYIYIYIYREKYWEASPWEGNKNLFNFHMELKNFWSYQRTKGRLFFGSTTRRNV